MFWIYSVANFQAALFLRLHSSGNIFPPVSPKILENEPYPQYPCLGSSKAFHNLELLHNNLQKKLFNLLGTNIYLA